MIFTGNSYVQVISGIRIFDFFAHILGGPCNLENVFRVTFGSFSLLMGLMFLYCRKNVRIYSGKGLDFVSEAFL